MVLIIETTLEAGMQTGRVELDWRKILDEPRISGLLGWPDQQLNGIFDSSKLNPILTVPNFLSFELDSPDCLD